MGATGAAVRASARTPSSASAALTTSGRFAQVREASRRVFSPESRSGDPFAYAGEKLARRVALAMAAAAPAPDSQDYADEEQYLAALADWNHGDEKERRRNDRQRTTDK